MSAESLLAALYPPDEEEVNIQFYFDMLVAVDSCLVLRMDFKIVAFDYKDR